MLWLWKQVRADDTAERAYVTSCIEKTCLDLKDALRCTVLIFLLGDVLVSFLPCDKLGHPRWRSLMVFSIFLISGSCCLPCLCWLRPPEGAPCKVISEQLRCQRLCQAELWAGDAELLYWYLRGLQQRAIRKAYILKLPFCVNAPCFIRLRLANLVNDYKFLFGVQLAICCFTSLMASLVEMNKC